MSAVVVTDSASLIVDKSRHTKSMSESDIYIYIYILCYLGVVHHHTCSTLKGVFM